MKPESLKVVNKIYRALCLVASDRSTPVAQRRKDFRDAVDAATASLDRDELVEVIYGCAALAERSFSKAAQ